MAVIQIQANLANLLTYIGSLYRSPADAIKEYTSNALDAWKKAPMAGESKRPCLVHYFLHRDRIVCETDAPGMSEDDFKTILKRVADSFKKGQGLIGELGIGNFAFNQFASSATFLSKKTKGAPTVKVVLRKESDKAEIETAIKREALAEPGTVIIFRGLYHNPLRARGPLSADVLQRFFAEKFDPYLREGNLVLTIRKDEQVYSVEPLKIDLPRIGEMFEKVNVGADWKKTISTQFWFDPTGKGKVAIRHRGVVIVDDLSSLHAYGLEESVFSERYVRGYIEADFLRPLPARTGFEENEDWLSFLRRLDEMRPSIEEEVEQRRQELEQKSLTEIQKRAVELAKEILNQEQFKSLEMLGGLGKRGPKKQKSDGNGKKGKQTGTKSQKPGDKPSPPGLRISYREFAFEDGPSRHSRFAKGISQVQVNLLNEDYKREWKGSEANKLAYGALMVGKETIAYNDKTGTADDLLEKLLAFYFQVRLKAGERQLSAPKRGSKGVSASRRQIRMKIG